MPRKRTIASNVYFDDEQDREDHHKKAKRWRISFSAFAKLAISKMPDFPRKQ